MTGFGDADKLAAAKELQRSFTTRSDTPRGSVRGGTTRGARASSTRGGLQPTASRGGFQSSPSSSSIRGRGGRGGRGGSATRGSFSPAVNSPSTSLTDVQHNTASRAASAQGLPGSATFGQLSTKYESNFGNISSGGTSGGLANSRFANESPPTTESVGSTGPRYGKQDADEPAKLTSGRMVGFYQSPLTEEDWKWIPDESEERMQGKKRRFSSVPDPSAPPFVSSKRSAPAVASSTAALDSVNPRYTGYYQDVVQQPAPSATQSTPVTRTPEQSSLQGAVSSQTPFQSVAAVDVPTNTTPPDSSTIQHITIQQQMEDRDMHRDQLDALQRYLQMIAPTTRGGDAMEVDEEP